MYTIAQLVLTPANPVILASHVRARKPSTPGDLPAIVIVRHRRSADDPPRPGDALRRAHHPRTSAIIQASAIPRGTFRGVHFQTTDALYPHIRRPARSHLFSGPPVKSRASYKPFTSPARRFATFPQTSIDADPFLGAAANPWTNRAIRIRLQTPEEVTQNNGQGASRPRCTGSSAMKNGSTIPRAAFHRINCRLPMPLHYFATPMAKRRNEGDPDTEPYVLGKVLQPCHSGPVQPRGVDLGKMSPDQLVRAIDLPLRGRSGKPYAH